MKPITFILLLGGVVAFIGCEPKSTGPKGAPPTTEAPSHTTVIVEGGGAGATESLDRLISDVQTAPTPQAEADALRRLRKYEMDHGLTYATRSFRTYDNAVVTDPSVSRDPVRIEVTIFRGRETQRTFQFIPKDNHNLALMGE
jgi:hypothetical protein